MNKEEKDRHINQIKVEAFAISAFSNCSLAVFLVS